MENETFTQFWNILLYKFVVVLPMISLYEQCRKEIITSIPYNNLIHKTFTSHSTNKIQYANIERYSNFIFLKVNKTKIIIKVLLTNRYLRAYPFILITYLSASVHTHIPPIRYNRVLIGTAHQKYGIFSYNHIPCVRLFIHKTYGGYSVVYKGSGMRFRIVERTMHNIEKQFLYPIQPVSFLPSSFLQSIHHLSKRHMLSLSVCGFSVKLSVSISYQTNKHSSS